MIRRLFICALLFLGTTVLLQVRVSAQSFDDAGLYVSPLRYELDMAPGETVTKQIRVHNATAEKLTLYPYMRDFTETDINGVPKFINTEKDISESLRKWITLDKTQFDAKQISSTSSAPQVLNVTITVPLNASPGGHYGGVIFSQNDPKNITQQPGNIAFSADPGVLFIVNIKGDVTRNLEIDKFYATDPFSAENKQQTFFEWFPIQIYTEIKNTGNTHALPIGSIIISQGDRLVESIKFNESQIEIIRDGSRFFENNTTNLFVALVPQTQTVGDLKTDKKDAQGNTLTRLSFDATKLDNIFEFGFYKAKLLAIYDDNGQKKTLVAETSFWVIPWKLLLLILAIIILIIGTFVFLKKRRRSKK